MGIIGHYCACGPQRTAAISRLLNICRPTNSMRQNCSCITSIVQPLQLQDQTIIDVCEVRFMRHEALATGAVI